MAIKSRSVPRARSVAISMVSGSSPISTSLPFKMRWASSSAPCLRWDVADLLAMPEHDEVIGDVACLVEIVQDLRDRKPLALGDPDECEDLRRLFDRHRQSRLVEHEHLPLERYCATDSDRKSTRLNSSHLGISY